VIVQEGPTRMTASDDNITPAGQDPVSSRSANAEALLWLAKWMGLPFLALVALYYAEPIFQPRPTSEFVQTVTHTEVYPTNGQGPSLAPVEVPRPKPIPFPKFPGAPAAPPSGSEIVAHPISQPQPVYPERAIEREKEGFVRVRITIAPDGRVSDVTVLLAQPPGWFEAAALDAVRRWTYQPPGRQLVTESVIEFKLN
jgi:TonB family protein